jgi:iron complex transport system permease protein
MMRGRVFTAYVLGAAAWLLLALLALKFGAVDGLDAEMIVQLRLPRVILAAAIGAGLAVSGAVLQAVFSNPLCEPYTLGISSGSALGAVMGASLGTAWSFAGLTGTSFVGALAFTLILLLISYRGGSLVLLLAGVMLGFLGSSLVSLWMALANPDGIFGALAWLLGDLSRARLSGAMFVLGSMILMTVWMWVHARSLDALLLGEEGALSVGLPVTRVRRSFVLTTSMMVATCVSAAGMIGFIGLIVPHFCRRLSGAFHRKLIPLCAIWGAASVTGADLLSRTIARPAELPVGVVTALIGAPLFIFLILRRRPE